MELSSDDLSVRFEIVPVEYDHRTHKILREIPLREKQDGSGVVRFRLDSDVAVIRVTNNGYKTAYYTLLDIQPDYVVNTLIPDRQETPAEFFVLPGQTVQVKRPFQFGIPTGVEVFKFVVSDKPLDLRPIFQTRGGGIPQRASGFERLFAQTFYNEETLSRGGKTIAVSSSEVAVSSFTFIIE
jgi:hypothetical protein